MHPLCFYNESIRYFTTLCFILVMVYKIYTNIALRTEQRTCCYLYKKTHYISRF
ncbi:hypothetical protein JCM18900_12212 [Psychrobacter sp. JCM 18900]|nr:hypothetical protein JCM18900_12212 [Psychrobacter sp. JCM 18900]